MGGGILLFVTFWEYGKKIGGFDFRWGGLGRRRKYFSFPLTDVSFSSFELQVKGEFRSRGIRIWRGAFFGGKIFFCFAFYCYLKGGNFINIFQRGYRF